MAEAQTHLSPVDEFEARRGWRTLLERIGWVLMFSLLLVGLGSVFARMGFMGEAAGVSNPADTFNAFDVRYALNPWATWLHLLPALLIAATGPLQFVRRVRTKRRRLHRISGRVYLVCGVIGALSGLYLGAVHPFSGWQGPGINEAMATIFFSTWTLFCLVNAYRSVRQKAFARHREWVIRSWAAMLGIATERILLGIFVTMTDVDISVLFGVTFWMAAAINIPAAEYWIHLTRAPGSGLRHWKDLDGR